MASLQSDVRTHGAAEMIARQIMESDECKQALKRLEDLYGKPPEDLEWGGIKD